jgi:DNA-binding transcriptional MocR family regulator
MSAGRRAAIADIARRYGLLLFEDDAYGFLPRVAPPALSSMAPERSFYVAGLAKCITPGLRIAYMVAPDPAQAARLAAGIRAATLMASPLMAALATQWIADGSAQAIIAAVRDESAARQRLARKLFPAGSYVAHPEGHHLWLTLPPGWSRTEFVGQMRQQGLAVVASDAFAVGGDVPNAVRVSLGATGRDELPRALGLLAEAVARGPALLCDVI